MKKIILSIFISGIWITLSEFLRNEILFKSIWINHYNHLGLNFQTSPLNGFLWLIWSFGLAFFFIYRLLTKFSMLESVLLSLMASFLMMWVTLYNLQVLPLTLLLFAIPLSLLETVVAAVIIKKLN